MEGIQGLDGLPCSIGFKCPTPKCNLEHIIVGCGCVVPGSIKMIDHPWLWDGVVTRLVVLEEWPRIIVASLDTITTEE